MVALDAALQAEALGGEAAHGPVSVAGPAEERVGDGRRRVDAVAGEDARAREAAAVEPAGTERDHHGDLRSGWLNCLLPRPDAPAISLLLCGSGGRWGGRIAAEGVEGVKFCRWAPMISHMLFADDSLLFFHATEQQETILKCLLRTY